MNRCQHEKKLKGKGKRKRGCRPKRNNHGERIKEPGTWRVFHDIPSAWMRIHRKTMHSSPWNHRRRSMGGNITVFGRNENAPSDSQSLFEFLQRNGG